MYEVEMKFPVTDPAALRRELSALGAQPVATHTQVDLYLAHPVRSFAKTDEALRVRQSNTHTYLTYKGPKIDRATKTRREIELEVSPSPSAAASLIALLEKLGFRPVREVHKRREALHVPWGGQTLKASLDQVAGLGEFIELELTVEPARLEESRQLLQGLAARLKLHESERRSYLELLLEKDAAAAEPPATAEDWSET